ncbi:MAG: DUF2851 family protein [Ginsengibacter sp.]
MTEKLLHFIWQFQYFSSIGLLTTQDETVQIIHPGTLNHNQGPDFLSGKINISGNVWAGNIELHVRSSDWLLHDHSSDKNYNNVILHVVWLDDRDITVKNNRAIPTLELQSRVSNLLLAKYNDLMQSHTFIPCENQIHQVNPVIITGLKNRMLAERLHEKSMEVRAYLKATNNNWEECFWWVIAAGFGSTLNKDQFRQVAQSLPHILLAKHKNQPLQIEALVFGQAGLLDHDFTDSYPVMLRKEYNFLTKKYSLEKANAPLFFLRMRPANFPTIRLAQLAVLISKSSHLFSMIKEATTLSEIKNFFTLEANDYWHYHYTFDELSPFKVKSLGSLMINNIIINTVSPMLFAFGSIHNDENIKDKAMRWLEELSPEKNTIINGFKNLGVNCKNSFESQALLQLKKHYCDVKRCLECAVGNAIIKKVT